MGPPDQNTLAGINVLVTRPEYQQQNLVNLVEQQGGQVFRFATLEIDATDHQQQLLDKLRAIKDYDIAVFVSPNAARYVFGALNENGLSLDKELMLACVGKGCADSVKENGFTVDAMPVEGVGSDGLLKHRLMQSVKDKRVIIFRGNGGRELLAESLKKRGAIVEYCECYQRRVPDSNPDKLISQWQQNKISIITITSTQALRNLWTLLGDNAANLITSTPMVVISKRIADVAMELGCKKDVLVSNDTSDASVVDAIKQWRIN